MIWKGTGTRPPIAATILGAPAIEAPTSDPDMSIYSLRAFPRQPITANALRWSLRIRFANRSRLKPRAVRHADQRGK